MNWIKNFVRPKIRGILGTSGMCRKTCGSSVPRPARWCSTSDLEANQFVIPRSGYHMRMAPEVRLKHTFDDGEVDRY